MIIDSQVHAYEANTPQRPWVSKPNWPASATGDEMVAEFDRLGIDGAIFISSFSMYGYDASYAVEVPCRRVQQAQRIAPNEKSTLSAIPRTGGTPQGCLSRQYVLNCLHLRRHPWAFPQKL